MSHVYVVICLFGLVLAYFTFTNVFGLLSLIHAMLYVFQSKYNGELNVVNVHSTIFLASAER